MKKRLHIGIRNALIGGTTLELYFLDGVHDYIDWEEFTMVNLVEDVINKVNAARPSKIIAYINSEGGSCNIGLAIYSFLKYLNVEVETRTLALAGSIASVLAQAASPGKRYIAKAAHMVIHEAWGYGGGTAGDMRLAASVLDTYTDTICGIYADVTGKPKDEIRTMIAPGDYWMTGEQAVSLGFADAIFDDVPQGFELNNALRDLDAHYVNVPEDLKPLTHAPAPPAASINTETHKNDLMKTIKEHVDTFAASVKNKIFNRSAPNLGEEVANQIAEPLTTMLGALNDEWEERFNEVKPAASDATPAAPTPDQITAITNSVREALMPELDSLTQANADLTQRNEALMLELAENKGGETTVKDEVIPQIGYGVKAAVPQSEN